MLDPTTMTPLGLTTLLLLGFADTTSCEVQSQEVQSQEVEASDDLDGLTMDDFRDEQLAAPCEIPRDAPHELADEEPFRLDSETQLYRDEPYAPDDEWFPDALEPYDPTRGPYEIELMSASASARPWQPAL